MKTLSNHITLFVVLAFLFSMTAQGQAPVSSEGTLEKGNFGIGAGLDYGGFGANLTLYPQKNIGLFLGAGYAINGLGYNVGTKLRFVSGDQQRCVIPYATLMYGYTAVIVVSDMDRYNKTFYDMTIGFGIDYKRKSYSTGAWSFAILVPFNNAAIQNYMDDLHNNQNIDFKNSILPIRLSIGYHFNF